jgi:hypothetical protein
VLTHRWSPRLEDRGCDNVVPGMGLLNITRGGAMVEWGVFGKEKRVPVSQAIPLGNIWVWNRVSAVRMQHPAWAVSVLAVIYSYYESIFKECLNDRISRSKQEDIRYNTLAGMNNTPYSLVETYRRYGGMFRSSILNMKRRYMSSIRPQNVTSQKTWTRRY